MRVRACVRIRVSHILVEFLPTVPLLEAGLSGQTAPRVPRHCHDLAADVPVGEPEGKVPWVVVHQLYERIHTRGTRVGLLDVDPP